MAIKLRIPRGKDVRNRLAHPAVKAAVAGFIIVCLVLFGIFAHYYIKYQKIVDRRLNSPLFANAAKIYSAPETVRTGESLNVGSIAAELRRAGYTEVSEHGESRIGTYKEGDSYIEVRPGAESYHTPESATIHVAAGKVDSITQKNGAALDAYELE
ncbi:MAG: penicillin-binding protein, partial [Acidobacteria bacterium]|nr:penicillin-binding protein [Acidobacteriota bacterium]